MTPKQAAESAARWAREDLLNHLGKKEEYFLVGKNDNEVQKPLIFLCSFPYSV